MKKIFMNLLNGFIIYKLDESDSNYDYYLYENGYGDYYILRIDKNNNVYEYAYNQDEDIDSAWSNKASLNYQKPSEAFRDLYLE